MIHLGSRRWGKISCQLPEDERLERDHYRIYILMAGSVKKGTNVSNVGQRYIAKRLKLSQMTVCRRQDELTQFGHIKPIERKHGQRGWFEMLSAAFQIVAKSNSLRIGTASARRRGSGVREAAAAWARQQDERKESA